MPVTMNETMVVRREVMAEATLEVMGHSAERRQRAAESDLVEARRALAEARSIAQTTGVPLPAGAGQVSAELEDELRETKERCSELEAQLKGAVSRATAATEEAAAAAAEAAAHEAKASEAQTRTRDTLELLEREKSERLEAQERARRSEREVSVAQRARAAAEDQAREAMADVEREVRRRLRERDEAMEERAMGQT